VSERSWVADAEAALRGETVDGVELLPRHRPPLLDASARRALLAPFIAAFLWAAVVFREAQHNPLEPVALVLRLLALALTVRAVLVLSQLTQRALISARRERYGLCLTEHGLLYRTPEADHAVAKQDVIDVREPGHWRERGGARWTEVYLVVRPSMGMAPSHLALPPVLEATPGVLCERLMRWRGVIEAAAERETPRPTELPSKLFDDLARGAQPAGVIALRHGRAWLQQAPHATVLLGVVVLDGYLRVSQRLPGQLAALVPALIALCLFVVPLGWVALMRANMAPRKGLSLVLTPAELMLRTRAGVLRVPWDELGKLELVSRTGWSILRGAHDVRTLVIQRQDEPPIHYAESFLGAPAEVVIALCEAYKKGHLP
jgi:hypothetical protein